MSASTIHIAIDRELDESAARPLVARIKAALRNRIPGIALAFGGQARIRSAAFLAFLEATRQQLEGSGGELRISCRAAPCRAVLEQFGFGGILDAAEPDGKE